ncbi:glycosyltransferase family 4 protein [Rhizorhabdus dicambivorans]|uniref:Glycosyltransferase family 1 protein n=1 Tax=Rhizorhabdus dicambivorans TaxID=1850238 RepID=A0A2A4FPW1_9SPHN|nr:glycosyltransferase family 1 protein [Rhizorhabdus dicambivorans]ATE66181.1 glycosyltransferase family 1 protein [Rhizorhabdus dicambivorans]PCE39742.1 glycosyltransferase family 1 protein [Rhizorhabdus dicambivorans]
MTAALPRLHLFLRRPASGLFSIEMLYRSLIPYFERDFEVEWIENRRPSRGFLPRLADAFRAALRQGDINHVTGDVHYLTYFLSRRRTVLTIHDFVSMERLRGLKRALLWFLWYWLPVRRADAIVVISHSTEAQLHRQLRIQPERVHVIPNPVRADFCPTERAFDVQYPRILQVGTSANKNLERHAEALAGIACKFVILGHLSDAQRACLSAQRIDYETHADMVPEDVASLYRGSDMLLFASTYEGFGMPILEAQASGIPVVTSNRWSMPEIAGAHALLVDPENIDDIRTAVLSIIGDSQQRQRLRAGGLENAARFAPAEIAARYASVYRNLCRAEA